MYIYMAIYFTSLISELFPFRKIIILRNIFCSFVVIQQVWFMLLS